MTLRQSKNRRLVIEDSMNEIAHNVSFKCSHCLTHFFDPKQRLFIVISVDCMLGEPYLLSLHYIF
ncbi:MAG TPA: hypothetical protein DCS93_01775 [Microscillaceae bacterium]|nr:hypothetical protein [Microscillaceae bacterium]